ncbi:MAG: DNA-binding Xre family transcriptional regulator [Oleiphilaceae bacterium]|jgi:DNA-binding Xre family transcriptional regulator
MAQTTAIIKVLKRTLKAHEKRYSDVAEALNLSEASVKRLFSEEHFSLKRLDQICNFLGIEITDLLSSMKDEKQLQSLTAEQEKQLVADTPLLLVANSVLNHCSFDDIMDIYAFPETELIQYLAKLDRLRIIQLLPNNRIKVLVDRSFSWLKNGPIINFFEEQVKKDFFNSRFNRPGEKRLFLVGMLSRASNEAFQRKLERLSEEFHDLHYEDEKLPTSERFGTSAVVAMRQWEPEIFESKRKQKDNRIF